MMQKLIDRQEEIVKFISTIRDFNISLIKNTNQLYLIEIYRILHLTRADHIFFSSTCGTFTKVHMFWDRGIQNMFSDQIGIQLEINNTKRAGKSVNIWKQHNSK